MKQWRVDGTRTDGDDGCVATSDLPRLATPRHPVIRERITRLFVLVPSDSVILVAVAVAARSASGSVPRSTMLVAPPIHTDGPSSGWMKICVTFMLPATAVRDTSAVEAEELK
jgi:hypothetical protein